MDYNRERIIGIQAAQKLGAVKTVAVIADQHKDFKAIFDTAIAEIGLDAVVTELTQASPIWAHAALVSIPDLGDYREALLKRAGEAPPGVSSPGTETPMEDDSTKAIFAAFSSSSVFESEISAISLKNKMAANCQFTAKWFDGGVVQPTNAYSDWNDWLWSSKLTAGCSQKLTLSEIAAKVPKSPLKNGDLVWIYVWVEAGTDMDGRKLLTSYKFTYQSGIPATADFVASGTTTINTLSVSGVSGQN